MKNIMFRIRKLFLSEGGNNNTIPPGPVGFEDAISATGFGRFNVLLLGFALIGSFAFIFDTTVLPYVIPSAECDLGLSLLDKGMLNAVTHAGMICSAPMIGYLGDTIGRKRVLFYGLIIDAICNIIATFSHNYLITLLFKFIAGFFVGGTNTMIVSLVAEFHSEKVRPSVVMTVGLFLSMAMLAVPIIALFFLTNPYDVYIGAGYELHSWQVYMLACTMPAVLSSILAFFIPESPRFLMSRNRTTEALNVLKRVYSMNTGRPVDTYPVKELKLIQKSENKKTSAEATATDEDIQELSTETALSAFKGGIRQLRPLFRHPHLKSILIMFVIHFAGVSGCNSLRLWLPQLFKMMSEYEGDGSLCDMISLGNTTMVEIPRPENNVCEPIKVNSETYINSIIVAGLQVALCAIASLIIGKVGKRRLLTSTLMIGGLCTLGLFWCADSVQATALAAFTVAFTAICMNSVLNIVVDLFPTSLRTTAVSLIMMIGRIGSITGSITFPALLAIGCLPPFLTFSSILIGHCTVCPCKRNDDIEDLN